MINYTLQSIIEKEDAKEIKGVSGPVSVFNKVSPEDMAKEQCKYHILGFVCPYVTARDKMKTSPITKIKPKVVRKYSPQFDKLTLNQGVFLCVYICNDVECHHVTLLTIKYQVQGLLMLHDGQSHQGIEWTVAFYWNTMYRDITNYANKCSCYQVAKGHYPGPKTQPGSLIANNPLDLLSIVFTKMKLSKDGKEDVLNLTKAFSKFSQGSKFTVANLTVDTWFCFCGIPGHIHSERPFF